MSHRWLPTQVSVVSAVIGVLGASALAEWPQFRGADRSGVSADQGLLKQWPEAGPPRKWLFRKAGLGYSGPSISNATVYLMGTRDGKEVLIALNEAEGTERWAVPLGAIYENGWGDGPRGTPTVDEERVYALSGTGDLVCAKVADGKILWRCGMSDFGGSVAAWGYCESPLVDGHRLVCSPGGDRGSIVALDKLTGDLIWQSADVIEGAQYASIVPADINGTRQYIQLFMHTLVSVNADDGGLIWDSPWDGSTAVVSTPIVRGRQVYVSSGYNAGSKLVEINDQNEAIEAFGNKVMKNHHGGVIRVGDHVYGYSDAGWVCQDFATGETVWSEKDRLGKGAIGCADGMLYCIDERDGTVALIEASPEGWNEHGRFSLDPLTELRKPSGGVWTHPVIANGCLYLRDQELLFCYNVRES